LSERSQAGDVNGITLKTTTEGAIVWGSAEKTTRLPLSGMAQHRFVEKVLEVAADGLPKRVLRKYDEAHAVFTLHGAAQQRSLRPERRLQVVYLGDREMVNYSPAGPLTREEWDLTGRHFNTLAIPALLPQRQVRLGDSWVVPAGIVQRVASLDAVIGHELEGRFEAVQGTEAMIRLTGSASGILDGAEVKVSMEGTLRWDLATRRWVSLDWKHREERSQGPVTPASQTTTTVEVRRSQPGTAAGFPADSNAPIPVSVPHELVRLSFQHPRGRWSFAYDRSWHVVAQSDRYVVFRLLERGQLLAQLNVSSLAKGKPGELMSEADILRLIKEAPEFEVGQIQEAKAIPSDRGYGIYRVSVTGKAHGLPLVQQVYALVGPKGDRILMSFTFEPENADRVQAYCAQVVASVRFAESE